MKTPITKVNLIFDAYGISDKGTVRKNNEDAFAVLPKQGLFVIADGIGGGNEGGTASQITVEVLPVLFNKRLWKLEEDISRTEFKEKICQMLQQINDSIVAQSKLNVALKGMGTTIVLAQIWKNQVFFSHLGDSRAYLLRNGELSLLTKDHTLAAQLHRWGNITDSQVSDNPGRSTLLRSLGQEEEVVPEFKWLKPESGDRILLCSDGLTDMTSDADISQIMNKCSTVKSCCKTLISSANMKGGKDNITVIVICIHKEVLTKNH